MKKALFFAVCLLAFASCKKEQPAPAVQTVVVEGNDSLQSIIDQREKEIEDIMAVFNEIQEGLNSITEAENRVTLAKTGEGSDRASKIMADIRFIQTKMKENKDLIEKLRKQLNESSIQGEELKKTMQKTIDGLVAQMEEKDRQLAELRQIVNDKDVKINQMGEAITTLNNDVSELRTENTQKQQTIDNQDKQLHQAYYVYGTKSELKEQNILEKGEVLKSNFNKNYFTKIDIRNQKSIKLYSKSAKVLTSHPASSYRLEQDATKQYTLHITDPDNFWRTSKYLVILVK